MTKEVYNMKLYFRRVACTYLLSDPHKPSLPQCSSSEETMLTSNPPKWGPLHGKQIKSVTMMVRPVAYDLGELCVKPALFFRGNKTIELNQQMSTEWQSRKLRNGNKI